MMADDLKRLRDELLEFEHIEPAELPVVAKRKHADAVIAANDIEFESVTSTR